MKTEEDEAFDDLAKKQGDWGGGFPAKRQMAADKLHWSDCAVHNGPAYPAGPCDCGPTQPWQEPHGYDWSMLEAAQESLREHMARIKELEAQLAQPVQEPVAWMTINAYGDEDDIWYENPEGKLLEGWTYKPLYTYPPTVQLEKEPLEYWNAVEGWVKIDEVREHFDSVGCGTIYKTAGEDRVPVYTTSQKREWVGLTDDKTVALVKQCRDAFAEELAAYDIQPPIQHIHQGHADCVAWLAAHNIGATK